MRYFLFRKMATYFGLRDQYQATITKILKIRCRAVQIKLVVYELLSLYKTVYSHWVDNTLAINCV
jgi:hypothetical protein